jgi:hypothetical protein
MGDPSLRVVGVLRSVCQGPVSRSYRNSAVTAEQSLQAVGALGLAYRGVQFPWCFRVKVAGDVVKESMDP